MKNAIIFTLFLCLIGITILPGCGSSKPTADSVECPVDAITVATPGGSKVKRAEEGLVRSILGQPEVDLDSFQLSVSGLVDSPFSLTWAEIQEHPAVCSGTIFMFCVEGWQVWGNWRGILVKDLLERASLKDNARHIMFHGVDGYTTALPIAYLVKYNAILAYKVNGEPLRKQDGYPLRLVAFGKYGYKWAKWVNQLEVMDESMNGYWEAAGYSDEANVPMERRIYYEGADAEPLDY